MRTTRQQIGRRGEDLAVAELQRQGLTVLERNWRCREGEIDIIALETGTAGVTTVFCEVKCRTGLGYGHPLESITYAKARKLRQLAAVWLTERRATTSDDHSGTGVRIDAIGIVMTRDSEPLITHVRGVGA